MSRTNFEPAEISTWPDGVKRCWGCKELLPFNSFHVMKQGLFGLNTYCKECRRPKSQKQYVGLSFEKTLWQSAQGRAKRFSREFTIVVDDIKIPDTCPVLGVPIVRVRNNWYAPSLDRIDSGRGYTRDNIMVMSKRANMLKNNMTHEEAKKLVGFLDLIKS